MLDNPVIIYFFGTDPIGKVLSNFAPTPFVLDGRRYESVEGFWQGLKSLIPEEREKIARMSGLDAKRAGQTLRGHSVMLVYEGKLYRVASQEHHRLLERAIRAKVDQNPVVRQALLDSGNRRLMHMLATRHGQLRRGDSPSLPAVTFEKMLTDIRTELQENRFIPELSLPQGI